MYRGYEYRIYPNKKQQELLAKTFGCTRYIYNWGLHKCIEEYQQNKKCINSFTLCKYLPELKKEFPWLKEVDSTALQQSLRHLDIAFTRFFKKQGEFPKYKSKKTHRNSFTTVMGIKLKSEKNRLQLTKLKDVKIVLDRLPKGQIKSVTIKQVPSGKYFTCLTVEEDVILPKKPELNEDKAIGIDLGIKDFAILSTGEKIRNHKFLNKSLKKLARLQKEHSRKQKGGKNREKARIKVARQYEKITNQRKDFLHNLSYRLTHEKQVDTLCLETLQVKNMVKNHNLARHIQDASWSLFVNYLTYKSDFYGKNILRIGTFEPSSKLCTCGYKNVNLTLADREWTCPICKTHHDRDILAANNIKRFAFHKQNLASSDVVSTLKS